MLPIAILPVAGLLLGIGESLSNPNMIAAYGLQWLLGEGTFFYMIFKVMSNAGNIVFTNLPLIFAMGVALGMAKKEKAVAVLASAISFFIMHTSIATMLELTDMAASLPEGSVTSVTGITSLQMGMFGGVLVGLGTAALHNRFYKIQLPADGSWRYDGNCGSQCAGSTEYLLCSACGSQYRTLQRRGNALHVR